MVNLILYLSDPVLQQNLLCHQEPIRAPELHTLYLESTYCVDIIPSTTKKKVVVVGKEYVVSLGSGCPTLANVLFLPGLLKILFIIPRHPFMHADS